MKTEYIKRKEFNSIDELITDAEKIGMKFKAVPQSDGVNQVAEIRFFQCGQTGLLAGKIYKTFNEQLKPVFYAGWYGID